MIIKINKENKINKIKKYAQFSILVSLFGSIGLLSGCAGMNDKFGCNAKAGDSCTPVSVVNRDAEAGDYSNVENGSGSGYPATQNYPYTSGQDTGYNVATPIPGDPVRYGETVQRIWIAPYTDSAHNYHEPSYVFTVLDKSHWVGLPAQSITSDSSGD